MSQHLIGEERVAGGPLRNGGGQGPTPVLELTTRSRRQQFLDIRTVETAQRQSEDIVADANAKADRIRSESERELAALTNRRDSINAQLTNVREMLATLTGAAVAATGTSDDEPVSRGVPAQQSR